MAYSEEQVLLHFGEFLRDFLEEYDYTTEDFYSCLDFDRKTFLLENLMWKNYEVAADSGAYKAVFLIDSPIGREWVLKIPFLNGDTCLCEMEDGEMLTEQDMYDKATDLGLEEFFAEPTRMVELEYKDEHIPFYAAKRMVVDAERIRSESQSAQLSGHHEYISHIDTAEEMCSDTWKALSDYYEEDDLVGLMSFVLDYGMHDLHSSNFGYNEFERPVIIDYN